VHNHGIQGQRSVMVVSRPY